MKKRTLSLLLCIVMMLSLLPTVAFADSPIKGVAVTDVQTPVLNASCSTSGITVTTAPNADAFKNSFTRWAKKVTDDEVWHFRLYDEPYKNMTESDTFEEGTYRLFLDVGIKDEYSFSDGCETTINGETATSILADSDQFIIIWSKEYSVTAPTPVTEVSIEGLKVPAAGDDIAAWLSSITYSNAEAYKYIIGQVFEGTHGDSEYTGKSEGVFSADKEYFFYVELAPNDGYVFDKDKLTVSMADISEMGHDLRSGGAKLNVASDYFTPTEPAACEIARVDITVDEPVPGMTPANMFDSVNVVAYDKDGNAVTEFSLEGSEAFCCETFSTDVLGIWSGSIEDASWYYGLGLYLVCLDATMARDVQVTVNGSDSSVLDVGVCDEIDILFPVFAMPVKPATFTISYDLNGGTMDGKTGTVTVDVKEGTVITLPAPTKEGFVFDYWEGSKYNAGDTYTVTGDHTFTAQWKEPEPTTGTITLTKSFSGIADDDRPINTATFTVTNNDGSFNQSHKVGDREFASTPAAGQFVWKLEDVPAGTYTITETAYDVDGYTCTVTYKVGTGNEQEGASATAALAAGEELEIIFTDTYTETVTVTFKMNGHGTQVPAQTIESGEKATKPKDPTASGYSFGGWYADEKLTEKFDFDTAVTEDTIVYAKWTKTVAAGTGDDSNMFLYAALMLMSGTALAATAIYGKKKIFVEK